MTLAESCSGVCRSLALDPLDGGAIPGSEHIASSKPQPSPRRSRLHAGSQVVGLLDAIESLARPPCVR